LYLLATQGALDNDEKLYIGTAPLPEDKKKAEDLIKHHAEIDNYFNSVSKRPYSGLILYGEFFPNIQTMMVRFQAPNFEIDVNAFYKNKYKVTCMIPRNFLLNFLNLFLFV
jgi:hypothetical protein